MQTLPPEHVHDPPLSYPDERRGLLIRRGERDGTLDHADDRRAGRPNWCVAARACRADARVCRRLVRFASAVLSSARYRVATQQLRGSCRTNDHEPARRRATTSVPSGRRATIAAVGFGCDRQLTFEVVVVAWAVPDIKPTANSKAVKTQRTGTSFAGRSDRLGAGRTAFGELPVARLAVRRLHRGGGRTFDEFACLRILAGRCD